MPTEKLTVTLTDDERNERARLAASLLGQYGDLEERKRETAKELGEELKALREQMDAAAEASRTGIEAREVEIHHTPNNERFTVETYREDTGELVRARPMTEDEARAARQQRLPLREGAAVVALSPLRGNTKGGQPS
jgi:hypothetical protein